ncbi:MAG: helix-turn-helix domain-containing protein [Bryobacterales bacterium]|nr:helix-turn-helix domain-containing protein [Bryobacterales bacterium]
MGNPRGVRRDFEALEKRRRAAVRLVLEEGWSQSAAARQVKAAQQSVSRWVGEYRRRGSAGLRRARHARLGAARPHLVAGIAAATH